MAAATNESAASGRFGILVGRGGRAGPKRCRKEQQAGMTVLRFGEVHMSGAMAVTRRRGAIGVVAAGLLGLGITGLQAADLSGREVRIGAIVPSSGPFAEWGRTNTVTLRMLEKQVNDAGGVNGAKLRIAIYDDAARPAQAANSLRKLAGDDKALAVAGPLTSSACEGAFPGGNQLKISATSR